VSELRRASPRTKKKKKYSCLLLSLLRLPLTDYLESFCDLVNIEEVVMCVLTHLYYVQHEGLSSHSRPLARSFFARQAILISLNRNSTTEDPCIQF